jgi:ligand-binding sensor domain-containing protein
VSFNPAGRLDGKWLTFVANRWAQNICDFNPISGTGRLDGIPSHRRVIVSRGIRLLGLALLFPALLTAAQPYKPKIADALAQPWRWRAFPELNGKGFQCMAEAKDTAMWFGLDEGAMRYDGLKWTFYTAGDGLKGAPVTALSGTGDGSVYAGTGSGLFRFSSGKWSQVFPVSGEANLNIGAIVETSDGSLWVGMEMGTLRIKRDSMILYASAKGADALKGTSPGLNIVSIPKPAGDFSISSIYQDRQKRIWFGANLSAEGGALLVLNDATLSPAPESAWQWHVHSADLDVSRRPLVLQDRNGTIWTVNSISRNKASRFDGKRWSSLSLSEFGGTDINTSLVETSDGAVWVGGFKKLHVLREGEWKVYSTPLAPIPPVRLLLLPASDGSVWVAGQKDEVLRLDYSSPRWTTFKDLNFHGESPDGTQWFLEWDGSVAAAMRGNGGSTLCRMG